MFIVTLILFYLEKKLFSVSLLLRMLLRYYLYNSEMV